MTGVTLHLEKVHLVVTRPDGKIFLTPREADDRLDLQIQLTKEEKARADMEKARADRLAAKLRELGLDPEEV